jgi:hypothetical protein
MTTVTAATCPIASHGYFGNFSDSVALWRHDVVALKH